MKTPKLRPLLTSLSHFSHFFLSLELFFPFLIQFSVPLFVCYNVYALIPNSFATIRRYPFFICQFCYLLNTNPLTYLKLEQPDKAFKIKHFFQV